MKFYVKKKLKWLQLGQIIPGQGLPKNPTATPVTPNKRGSAVENNGHVELHCMWTHCEDCTKGLKGTQANEL
jgi:hypothetical protein